ncbi:hypothetical protein evm_010280 [Chilo suppressalis]|nr:hypothetical protein evm_010280 [Chilo suppressalis]
MFGQENIGRFIASHQVGLLQSVDITCVDFYHNNSHKMDKRAPSRVSEAQWSIMMDFLESNPNLARARGYNNSARGRSESLRLWQEVANLLNAEGSGTTKSPKEWSVYVSNYKSKLKKIVADINTDASATGGGPPRASTLNDWDRRFLALLGPGFGQTAPRVMVQPFPEEQAPTSSRAESEVLLLEEEGVAQYQEEVPAQEPREEEIEERPHVPAPPVQENLLPRRSRQRRQHTRPLAPLDEARRILSQVEMQRAASDAANARANQQAADNLLPLGVIGRNLGRLADVAERYMEHIVSLGPTP